MLGEAEAEQAHNAEELGHSARSNEEGGPLVAFFLHEQEGEHESRHQQGVDLSIEHTVQDFLGAEPTDEHLLILREPRALDCEEKEEGDEQFPNHHPHPIGQQRKGCYQRGKCRAIEEVVCVFLIERIERHVCPGMVEGMSENEIVPIWMTCMNYLVDGKQGNSSPHECQRVLTFEKRMIESCFELICHDFNGF